MAIDHLVARGRRDLAFMTWGQPSAIIKHARAAGLDLNLNWLRCDLPPAAQGSGWEEFREIWTSERRRPDGIVITDNVLFEDALHAMIESKVSVPEELLVVTHASKGVVPWTPFPVTRIEVDAAGFAETASQLLLDMMHRRQKGPVLIELPCALVEPIRAQAVDRPGPTGSR
jgi:DNA-binding LacI/PurR family transcriptional regulator